MFLNQELFEHCYVRVFSYIFVTLFLFLPARVFLPPEMDFRLCVCVCACVRFAGDPVNESAPSVRSTGRPAAETMMIMISAH